MKGNISTWDSSGRAHALIGITPPDKYIPLLRGRIRIDNASVLIPRVLNNSTIPKVKAHNKCERLIRSINLAHIAEVHAHGVIARIQPEVEVPSLKCVLVLDSIGEHLVENKNITPIAPCDPPALEVEDDPLEPPLVDQDILVQEVLVRGVDVDIVDIEGDGSSLLPIAGDIAVGVKGPDGIAES